MRGQFRCGHWLRISMASRRWLATVATRHAVWRTQTGAWLVFTMLLLMPPPQAMTLEQKVAQMFFVSLDGAVPTEDGLDFLARRQPGGMVLFEENARTPEATTRLTNAWQQAVIAAGGPPLIIAVDQEGGRINALEDPAFTHYPAPAIITATGDSELAYQTGAALATELRAVGIQMNLAPVADLETNPDNPVIFRRSFGSDPVVVSPALVGVVDGLQANGVLATLKHFPGHGDTDEDSHVTLPTISYDKAALEQLELRPFQAGIDAGAGAVMVGHLLLPEIDPDSPASLSHAIVTGLLREEMGFDGLILTDALDMDAIDTRYTVPGAVVRAVEAGVDVLAMGPNVGMLTIEQSMDAVVQAVRDGEIDEARIDASVARIVQAKAALDLQTWEPLDPTTASERVRAARGPDVVRALFTAGVTLVYDSPGLVPPGPDANVLLLYPLHRTTVRRACEAVRPDARQWGYNNFPTEAQIMEAARLSRDADVVAVFTQNAVWKTEQAQLVNALPPEKTVVVAYWSPYDLNAFDVRPGAYLTTYSPTDDALEAACGVVFGAIEPRGQLPMSIADDLPAGIRVVPNTVSR